MSSRHRLAIILVVAVAVVGLFLFRFGSSSAEVRVTLAVTNRDITEFSYNGKVVPVGREPTGTFFVRVAPGNLTLTWKTGDKAWLAVARVREGAYIIMRSRPPLIEAVEESEVVQLPTETTTPAEGGR
jgi:hypothetical protein